MSEQERRMRIELYFENLQRTLNTRDGKFGGDNYNTIESANGWVQEIRALIRGFDNAQEWEDSKEEIKTEHLRLDADQAAMSENEEEA